MRSAMLEDGRDRSECLALGGSHVRASISRYRRRCKHILLVALADKDGTFAKD